MVYLETSNLIVQQIYRKAILSEYLVNSLEKLYEKVDVLISTYNGAQFIEEQIYSVLNQNWHNTHICIRDDGSTDQTVKILNRLMRVYPDKLTVITGSNIGVVRSYFWLLRHRHNSDYYALCDQDDVWSQNKLSHGICALQEHAAYPTLYFSKVEFVDKNLMHIGLSQTPKCIGFNNALVQNIAPGCTIIINKLARDLVNSKLPSKCIMHDWWLYLAISAFGEVIYDDVARIKYRQHGANVLGGTSSLLKSFFIRYARWLRSSQYITCSEQAGELHRLLGDQMPAGENKELLRQFIEAKHSMCQRMRLLVSSKLRRISRIDTLLLYLSIILNRY